jgi:hypothetical protein
MEDDLSIAELIEEVSEQLIESRARRLSHGKSAMFEVAEVMLEVSFVATSSSGGSGGFDLKVIKADALNRYDHQAVQKVTLKLKPLESPISVLTELEEQPAGLRPRLDE